MCVLYLPQKPPVPGDVVAAGCEALTLALTDAGDRGVPGESPGTSPYVFLNASSFCFASSASCFAMACAVLACASSSSSVSRSFADDLPPLDTSGVAGTDVGGGGGGTRSLLLCSSDDFRLLYVAPWAATDLLRPSLNSRKPPPALPRLYLLFQPLLVLVEVSDVAVAFPKLLLERRHLLVQVVYPPVEILVLRHGAGQLVFGPIQLHLQLRLGAGCLRLGLGSAVLAAAAAAAAAAVVVFAVSFVSEAALHSIEQYLSSVFLLLAAAAAAIAALGATGVDSRLAESSSAVFEESRDAVVASVEDELVTLTELASTEFRVEARLCLEVLRRSMLSGLDGALSPGPSPELLGNAPDDAQIRPRKRAAAVAMSDVRAALAVATRDSRYPCSSWASFSRVTVPSHSPLDKRSCITSSSSVQESSLVSFLRISDSATRISVSEAPSAKTTSYIRNSIGRGHVVAKKLRNHCET
ncbi:hypothetical protein Trco_003727 [Trichoderma cornu-damae]|uniref:Uncharacterized protein n=1 Tax=Trichoderma cornu-damae TaxID=654480 RepID=A0A9P8TW89_9HYPO|nr:hypothetical protein Trco_003727 [Trichoderma cornu-damae]